MEFHEFFSSSSRIPKGPSVYFISGIPNRLIPAEENIPFPCSMAIFSSSDIPEIIMSIFESERVRSFLVPCDNKFMLTEGKRKIAENNATRNIFLPAEYFFRKIRHDIK
jgi:hypothetical protein